MRRGTEAGRRPWSAVASVVAVLVVVVALAGCGDDDEDDRSSGGAGDERSSASGSAPKVYGPGDSITIADGKTFVIELEANPTTGYSWSPEPNPNAELVDSEQVRQSTLPGAPGVQRLTFRATATGSSTLVLSYARPFEPDSPPAETESFPLTVR